MPLFTPPKTLLTTAHALHTTFSDFLIVAIHTLLYERALYPRSTFLLTRAYNFPVRQNRHPKVCRWVMDAVSSIQTQMARNTIRRVVFVVFSPDGAEALERFIFDVERFPVVPERELYTELVSDGNENGEEQGQGEGFRSVGVNAVDVEEQLRAAIRKLAYCGGKLGTLPEGCSYTVMVELKDSAEAPIGHPQPWVASQPSLQTGEKGGSERIGSDVGGVKSVPVGAVEVGEFILETWIEEGKAKKKYVT